MQAEGGHFQFFLPLPAQSLVKVFDDIKSIQKDNLNAMEIEGKDDKVEDEVKGLKFIARKIKILLQKNKKIQYNEASRILISNFASEEKGERNIKRRVYDAINVLVSAGVVMKDGNKIQLPNSKFLQNKNFRDSIGQAQAEQKLKNETVLAKKKKLLSLKDKIKALKKVFCKKVAKVEKGIVEEEYFVASLEGKVQNIQFCKKYSQTKIKCSSMMSKPCSIITYLKQNNTD